MQRVIKSLRNAMACQACPTGWATTPGQLSVMRALPGKYGYREGLSKCKRCQNGTYQDQVGSHVCKHCNSGRDCLPISLLQSTMFQQMIQSCRGPEYTVIRDCYIQSARSGRSLFLNTSDARGNLLSTPGTVQNVGWCML